MKPILVVKLGEALPEIRERHGDFEVWLQHGMQHPSAHFRVVDVPAGGVLPSAECLAGVVLTGSAAMVSERERWSEHTASWLLGILDANLPMLGICYGHQLIAHALGGRVGPNPRGREIGTTRARLRAGGDELFGMLPAEVTVQTTHVEAVLELPVGAERLGETALDPNHVYRVGDRVWGVQFHPEFDVEIMRGYIQGRRPQLEEEGLDADRLLENCEESPAGARVLARFAELVRGWSSD